MTDNSILIRPATVADIDDVVRLRRQMFLDMGYGDKQVLDDSDTACHRYFLHTLPSGEYRGWLAIAGDDHAVASGGLVIDCHPPGPNNPGGRVGYIMNIVTEPEYRRQGLARRILDVMMQWLVSEQIDVATLHATEMGRLLYEEFGFEPSNEMRARLRR